MQAIHEFFKPLRMPSKNTRIKRAAMRYKRSPRYSPRLNSADRQLSSSAIIRKSGGNLGKIYSFSRWADLSPIYSTTNSEAGGTVVLANTALLPTQGDVIRQMFSQLDVLPNFAEFQALFSQYRIMEMEFHFLNCMYTEVNAPSGALNGSNTIRNFPVYIGTQTDTLGVVSINQMQQEEGVTVRDYVNNGKPLIIKVMKPSANLLVGDDANLPAIAAEKTGQWLDTAASDIPHRGVYIGLQDTWAALGQPTVANRVYTVRVKMSLEFRGVR